MSIMSNKNIISFIQNKIKKISLGISSVFLLIIAFTLISQVILRFLFSAALPWAEEVARYSTIWLVMMAANVLIMDDELIKIDFFDKLWPKKLITYRNTGYRILFIFLFLVFIKEGWLQALSGMSQRLNGLFAVGIDVRFFWVYLSIPVGVILMLIQLLIIVLKDFNLIRK